MRNCLLVFVVILFVLLVSPFFITLNLSQTLLSKNFIKSELNKVDLYNRIVKINPEELVKVISGEEAKEENVEGFKSVMSSVSPEIIKNTIEPNLDRIYLSIFENGPDLVKIDLAFAKKAFMAKAPDPETKQFFSQMQDEYLWTLPREVVRLKNYINRPVKYLLPLGLVVLVLFILGIVLPRGGRAKMRSASFLLLMAALTLSSLYILGKMLFVSAQMLKPPQSVKPIINDLLRVFQNDLLKLFLVEAIIFSALAITLFLLGFLFKRPQVNTAAAN